MTLLAKLMAQKGPSSKRNAVVGKTSLFIAHFTRTPVVGPNHVLHKPHGMTAPIFDLGMHPVVEHSQCTGSRFAHVFFCLHNSTDSPPLILLHFDPPLLRRTGKICSIPIFLVSL